MDQLKTAAAAARDTLEQLTALHLTVSPGVLSLDLSAAPEKWETAIRTLGRKTAYERLGALVCARYQAETGQPFLFSDACVAYELGWHIDAYLWTRDRRWPRPLLTRLFSRDALERHCRTVDIAERDLHTPHQRIIFRYKKGLRQPQELAEKKS